MAFLTTGAEKCPKHLKFVDVQCPICLSILIEPVTLPCRHELCMPCFKDTLDKVNLCCPLCRTRISSWTRRATRQNRLINQTRWTQIKQAFPELVDRRLKGTDDSQDMQNKDQNRQLTEPGGIRMEYESEKQKVINEKFQHERLNEEKLWKYLRETGKESDTQLLSISLVSNEEIASSPVEEKIRNKRQDDNSLLTSELSTKLPEYQYKLNPVLSDETSQELILTTQPEVITISSSASSSSSAKTRSESTTSNDSISQELRHFKPIKIAPKTPPKPQPDGRLIEPPLVLAKPRVLRDFSGFASTSSIETHVPLRRKLSEIVADRSKKPRKTKPNANLPADSTLRKQILPLEPDISIADQTSTYNPSTSFTARLEESLTSSCDEKLIDNSSVKTVKTSNVADNISSSQKEYLDVLKGTGSCDNRVVKIVEQQIVLMNKLKQEEADWKLAQKLQQREMQSCRSKREPYFLRKRHITAVPVVNGGQRRKHV
uniref:RING-type E3 ubiquitin transferase n=1 Tax=Strigamia maritima TaxID=126957 RepID=T1JLR6_STRMM